MRDRKAALEEAGIQVLVVDPHEPYRVRHMLRSAGFEGAGSEGTAAFPVLADPVATVSARYGVAMQMRIHGEWSNRPATFLIDRDGVIRFRHLARTFRDRPDVNKVLRVGRQLAGIPEENVLALKEAPASTPPVTAAAGATYSEEELLEDAARSEAGHTIVSVFHPRCAGCLTEAIALRDTAAVWKRLGVPVLALAVSTDAEAVKSFRERAAATHRIERAPWAIDRFDVRFYPSLIVIDGTGKEVFRAAEDTEEPVAAAQRFLEGRIGAGGRRSRPR